IGVNHERTGKPVSAEYWLNLYASEGQLSLSESELRDLVFHSGVEDDIRVDVWKYLLRVYDWDSTEAERNFIKETNISEYLALKAHWKTILAEAEAAGPQSPVFETPPSQRVGGHAGDEKEDADVVTKIKDRKYRIGLYSYFIILMWANAKKIEKDVVRTDRTVPFFSGYDSLDAIPPPLPGASNSDSVMARNTEWDGQSELVLSINLAKLRDVLISYSVWEFELGYVQGMNDLLAPILAVVGDEVESFAALRGYMSDMKYNFYRDQSGMKVQLRMLELLIRFMDPVLFAHLEQTDSSNLFCCFRWLLLRFKREFNFDDIMRLWEVFWACRSTKHFHLFFAFAIMNQHRRQMIANCRAFDETLKYINDLSGKINVEETLERAEILFLVFKENFSKITEEIEKEVVVLDYETDERKTNFEIKMKDDEILTLAGLLEPN
ncbi:GTPase activating protein, partial [Nowakowskiella sp. JEL0078]